MNLLTTNGYTNNNEEEEQWCGYVCEVCLNIFKKEDALIHHIANRHPDYMLAPDLSVLEEEQQQLSQQTQYLIAKNLKREKLDEGYIEEDFYGEEHFQAFDKTVTINNKFMNFSDDTLDLKIVKTVSLAGKTDGNDKSGFDSAFQGFTDPLLLLSLAPPTTTTTTCSSPAKKSTSTNKRLAETQKSSGVLPSSSLPLLSSTSKKPAWSHYNNKSNNPTNPSRNVIKQQTENKTKDWFNAILTMANNSKKLPNFGSLMSEKVNNLRDDGDDDIGIEEGSKSFQHVIQSHKNQGANSREDERPISKIISKLMKLSDSQKAPDLNVNIVTESAMRQVFCAEKVFEHFKNDTSSKSKIQVEQTESNKRTKTRVIKRPSKLDDFSTFEEFEQIKDLKAKKKIKSGERRAEVLNRIKHASSGVVPCFYSNCPRRFTNKSNMIRHTKLNHGAH